MKKVYFLSDIHLGAKTIDNPLEHEQRVVRFLDSIKDDASDVYLMGDIIDYWFEYKTVVPRGFTRFLGKISELTDRGVKVHWFTGNHDIWIFDYIPSETGAIVYTEAVVKEIMGKKFYLAHGDGLGDDSLGYKIMHRFFRNKFCQKIFSGIHPRWTVSLAHYWSKKSRLGSDCEERFLGEEKEHLVKYTKGISDQIKADYYIYGHRHIILDMMMADRSRILILGDWINHFSYAIFDGENIWIDQFEEQEAERHKDVNVSIAF